MQTPRRCDLARRALAHSLTTVLVLAGPGAARAGTLAPLQPAAKALDLLAGRLTIRVPAGARTEARRASIMAAPAAAEDESRVVIDAGPERMVLMVNELFSLAGPKLEAAVKKESAGSPWGPKGTTYSVEKLALKGLSAFALLPAALKVQGDAALALAAYVSPPDGTVQLLRIYVNPRAARDPKGSLGLARRLLATVAAGPRKLQTAAGVRRLAAAGREIQAKVPAGYHASAQAGPDFQVHQLRKLVPLGAVSPSLGIYLGAHPSYQHKQSGGSPKVTERKGKLLGGSVSWHEWAFAEPGAPKRFMLEAITEAGANLRAHVFYGAEKPAELKELQSIAESLRFTKK